MPSADRGEGPAAGGAFRRTCDPVAAQKFAGCFHINFEGSEVVVRPSALRSSHRVSAALRESVLRASGTRRTTLSGRSVNKVKTKLTVEGAGGASGMEGSLGADLPLGGGWAEDSGVAYRGEGGGEA